MSKKPEQDPQCCWNDHGYRCDQSVGYYPPGRSSGYCTLHGFMIQGYSHEQAHAAVAGLERQIGRKRGESWVDWKERQR